MKNTIVTNAKQLILNYKMVEDIFRTIALLLIILLLGFIVTTGTHECNQNKDSDKCKAFESFMED